MSDTVQQELKSQHFICEIIGNIKTNLTQMNTRTNLISHNYLHNTQNVSLMESLKPLLTNIKNANTKLLNIETSMVKLLWIFQPNTVTE